MRHGGISNAAESLGAFMSASPSLVQASAGEPSRTSVSTSDSDPLGWVVLGSSVVAMLAFAGLDLFVGLPATGAGSTISAYVYTDGAWVFRGAVLALVVAAAVLLLTLNRRRVVRWWSPTSVLLALTILGLLAVAVFPKTDWAVGDSLPGQLHRLGSMVAFLAPPFATIALTRRRGAAQRLHLAARGAFWSSLSVFAVLVGTIALVVVAVNAGGAWWQAFPLGLIERLVVGFELLAMALLGFWIARPTTT